ncbi:MAG: twin-arginine translocase TatA/TatE family subunit [Proteobacteria bacterium]|jgi:sec-independent protein translocase protein TatA|nr:twin-arginine translocase TatA/TatE family subunit [Pseudomonadota bacterium]
MPVLAIGMPGPWEIGLILVIVLIVFGAGKLPHVLESFGKGIKQFRDAQKDEAIDVTKTSKSLTEQPDEVEQMVEKVIEEASINADN